MRACNHRCLLVVISDGCVEAVWQDFLLMEGIHTHWRDADCWQRYHLTTRWDGNMMMMRPTHRVPLSLKIHLFSQQLLHTVVLNGRAHVLWLLSKCWQTRKWSLLSCSYPLVAGILYQKCPKCELRYYISRPPELIWTLKVHTTRGAATFPHFCLISWPKCVTI